MPLIDGVQEYPNDYPEMRGLILEHVEDGVYRRKGAWGMSGRYSHSGFADHEKVARMWRAKGADRIADKTVAGLDEGEFTSVWDDEVSVLKII
jgi:hypothetical protein